MSEVLQQTDGEMRASFTLGNRMRRVLWGLVCAVTFRPTPRTAHRWRAMILRMMGATVGKNTRVYAKARIWAPWNVVIDDNVAVAEDVYLYSMGRIHLKARSIVSQGTFVCAGTHDYEDPNFQLLAQDITIGENVWVCAQAFIGPGVTIGENAVIGARAVAMRDMPANMVCAGNPCRPLKPRVIRPAKA